MLTRRLLYITQRDADVLAEQWLKEILESPFTATYRKLPQQKLLEMAKRVYHQLERWFDPEGSGDAAGEYYELGRKRRREGYALEEVVVAILLSKRVLWDHIVARGLPNSSFELYTALDVNNQVVDYFDRAIYHFIMGYADEESGYPRPGEAPREEQEQAEEPALEP